MYGPTYWQVYHSFRVDFIIHDIKCTHDYLAILLARGSVVSPNFTPSRHCWFLNLLEILVRFSLIATHSFLKGHTRYYYSSWFLTCRKKTNG